MTDQDYRERVAVELATMNANLKALKELFEQRIASVERSMGKVWWVIGIVAVALVGAFVGHVLTAG